MDNKKTIGTKSYTFTGHGVPTIISKYGEEVFEISNNYITPLELVLWTYDKQQMIIKRPNISMIFKLKKLCINCKFGINELLKEIKFYVLIGVFVDLFLFLALLFS